jgi:alkylation response protein AidB-like acyl-CoA dehydrogenase
LIVAAHNSLCTNHIYLAGNDEQRRKYIPKLATGEWIGCWSLTEPEAGSDAAGTRTVAVLRDHQWVLNGGKTFCTNAHYADVCVAMAVTDRSASAHGISAFILEKGTPGFTVGKKENKMGMRSSATGDVLFADCHLPESQLCGKPGAGFVDSLRVLDGGRISIAALSVGIAQRVRCGIEVLKAAQAIRKIHFRIPGDPTQARRYGHLHRSRALAHFLRRGAQRRRPAGLARVCDGETLRFGNCRPGRK